MGHFCIFQKKWKKRETFGKNTKEIAPKKSLFFPV